MKLGIVGGGVMGEAFIVGLTARQIVAPSQVTVSDIRQERLRELADRYGVGVTASNAECVRGRDVVILAVKPQSLPEVYADLRGRLDPGQLVISIVAGARLAQLSLGLHHEPIVRVMSNLPAQIGEGISVWTAAPAVSAQQRELTCRILGALGREIWVPDELYIDMATAVSGSGPAYVFLFMEAMVDGAVHIGLPREVARELVIQSFVGAALFARQSGRHLAELKNMVTSPGGTTTEGLLMMEDAAIRAAIIRGIAAAYEKSQKLGR
ncbi:MAG: pyrroline-5-carboxylate reductase [Chloroflexota bacterium]